MHPTLKGILHIAIQIHWYMEMPKALALGPLRRKTITLARILLQWIMKFQCCHL